MSKKHLWGVDELAYVASLNSRGLTWQQVTEDFNEKYHTDLNLNTIRKAYKYHLAGTDQAIDAKLLQATRQARKTNAKVSRENAIALDALNAQDDLLEEIQNLVGRLPKTNKPKIPTVLVPKGKKTTFELLLSDYHQGKLTESVNSKVLRERLREYTSVCIFKILKEAETYDVHEVIVGCLGDIIESATMHREESLVGCEFGNSKQVAIAIESIYEDFILPLSELQQTLGFKFTFIGVAGNHDRTEVKKTFHNPGEELVTYTIYKTLEMICKHTGIDLGFIIPVSSYVTYDIFGCLVLYEHGDRVKLSRESMERHLGKRSTQVGHQITGMRIGHWHEGINWGQGRFIVNPSVVGQDSFSNELGYDSVAGQTIIQHVETKKRKNCFYQSFIVHLEGRK